MKAGIGAWLFVMAAAVTSPPTWTIQTSGVLVRLRGVSAVSERVCWASGQKGTVLRTTDAGATWTAVSVRDAGELDFRDIEAVDERVAYVLSIGPGESSRIFKTADGGGHWALQFVNHDPKAFLDSMAFWDARRGLAVSDSVAGRFVILQTTDGGANWKLIPQTGLPPALAGEGFFAASGTNVSVIGRNQAWLGTGAGRVLRTGDGGRTWTVVRTSLTTGASAGIFSIAFRDGKSGYVVGGDYKKESEPGEAAASTDGGTTWKAVSGLAGYRSAVAYVPGSSALIAVGPTGADYSTDGGARWTKLENAPGFDALSFVPRAATAWAVGDKGRIARMEWREP